MCSLLIESSLTLDTPVVNIDGIGNRLGQRLHRLGLITARDLLFHLPKRYQDTRELVPLNQLKPGSVQTVLATIVEVTSRRSRNKKMVLVEATLESDGAVASAIWFNQPFLARKLREGTELLFSGKVEAGRYGFTLRNPTFEPLTDRQKHVGVLSPIYPQTEGLSSKVLREVIEPLLPLTNQIEDPLPDSIREEQDLPALESAIRWVHLPSIPEEHEKAFERLAFDELFLLQVAALRARKRRLQGLGAQIPYDVEVAKRFVATLAFSLTTDQRVAAHEILSDLAEPGPMNRLLHGDVGSGKTVVAAMATVMVGQVGYQTVIMAPTEILARQHHRTFCQLLEAWGIIPRLLLGSTSQKARREILDGIVAGHDLVIIGTHALLEDEVKFSKLGLVVVDEQHRFGVAQRQKLRLKAETQPNFLSMTATPIPRSLTLTAYGDLNISALKIMPPGRIPILTKVIKPEERENAYEFIRDHIKAGQQAFVICPLIEESDKLNLRNVTAEYERLRDQIFSDLNVELLHGRMMSKEKDQRMQNFVNGQADILVATSVVEVGVDIPNATIMAIEGAERFGLAQLHQFRGRVGRGDKQSFCLLFQDDNVEDASKRLELVASINNGFELSEWDLRLRGPGSVVGLRQHGLPEIVAADLLDEAMLQRARKSAAQWLELDPELMTYPPLTQMMNNYSKVFDLD